MIPWRERATRLITAVFATLFVITVWSLSPAVAAPRSSNLTAELATYAYNAPTAATTHTASPRIATVAPEPGSPAAPAVVYLGSDGFLAAKATEGAYEVVTREGLPYVGQSGNIDCRLAEHVRSGKISQDAADNAARTEVLGGKTAREIAEQQRINELTNGVGARDPGIANQRNPIGPARQHLLP